VFILLDQAVEYHHLSNPRSPRSYLPVNCDRKKYVGCDRNFQNIVDHDAQQSLTAVFVHYHSSLRRECRFICFANYPSSRLRLRWNFSPSLQGHIRHFLRELSSHTPWSSFFRWPLIAQSNGGISCSHNVADSFTG